MAVPSRSKSTAPPPPTVTPSRGGDIIQGRIPERRADPTSLPKLPPHEVNSYRYPFSYWHNPNKWQFLVTKSKPDGEWLPSLTAFPAMPGANRVRTGGGMNIATPALTAQGFKPVPKHLGPGGDYNREHDVVITGKGVIARINLSAWDYLVVNGDATERKFDHKNYRDWLRTLMAQHVIDAPPQYVAIRMVRQKQARIERLSGLPSDNVVVKERIAKENETLKKMAASFAAQFGFNPLVEGDEFEAFARDVAGNGALPDQAGEEAV